MQAMKYEKAFRDCMIRMTAPDEQQIIMEQLNLYKNSKGDFAMRLAVQSRSTQDPSKWILESEFI